MGRYPHGNLIKVGSELYGVTQRGGANDYGCIFSIDPATDTYNVEFSFNGTSDGGYPSCGLFAEGNVLYGLTKAGSTQGAGSVYSFDLNTNTFTLRQAIASGEQLFGLQRSGDSLYSIHYDGSNTHAISVMDLTAASPSFSNVVNIDNSTVGSKPGPHLSLSNNFLYGLMNDGGANGKGGLFSYDLTNNTVFNILSFDEPTCYYGFNSELLISPESIGLEEVNGKNLLNLYPNPSSGTFQTDLENIDHVIIRSISGSRVPAVVNGSSLTILTDVPGVNLVTIESKGLVYHSRVVVQ